MDLENQDISSRKRLMLDLKRFLEREARPGDRLPAVRELTRRYNTSPVTVSQVLAELTRQGLIVTRPGQGTFVAQPPTRSSGPDLAWQTVALSGRPATPSHIQDLFRPPGQDMVPFGSGYLDEGLQPLSLLQAALKEAGKRPGVWSRLPPEGLEPLRALFARELGGGYRASDVLIVPGGQSGLSTTLRALLPHGAPLLVESPTYYGILAAAQAAGVQPVPIPADQDGIRPELLEEAFRLSGAKVLYLQPLYANPTGAILSPARRMQVLEIAERAGAFIIEDDYARELTLQGTAPPPLAQQAEGRVIYLRSLTKAAAPGLRIAALVAQGPVLTRLRHARAIEEYFPSGPLQEAALSLLVSRGWQRHLRDLQDHLRLRRDTLVQALVRHCPQVSLPLIPRGGYNLWVQLPAGISDLDFVEKAARIGVQVSAGGPSFPAEPSGTFIRLSYAAAPPARIEEGVRKLGGLLNP